MVKRSALLLSFLTASALLASAQYKLEPVANPPSDIPPAYAGLIQKNGYRIAGPSGPFCEVWFRTGLPSGPKSVEESVAFPTVPHGTFLGVIRFPDKGADRRGQSIKPGLYTMRYSMYPVNGDHVGVAPQRDFAVLSPIAEDKDPNATPAFEPLVAQGRKTSGTPHPAVLSLEPAPPGAAAPALRQEGEKDWALTIKLGDTPISIILIGKSDA